MTRDQVLILLALAAMAPSVYRWARPEPRPLVVHASAETPEGDRIFFGERMDLNRADAEALQLVPGIGPALAARIVEDRVLNGPFASVEDVERVRGIGAAKRAVLQAWVDVR